MEFGRTENSLEVLKKYKVLECGPIRAAGRANFESIRAKESKTLTSPGFSCFGLPFSGQEANHLQHDSDTDGQH